MNTDAKRYYALLGLTPACSDEDIRSAFRRRAKELHPDAGAGDANDFIRLKRAYDTLNDPATRARYDRACNPSARRVGRQTEAAPLPPRPRGYRSGGMSMRRYAVAFLFVGGLSFGAIEWMISDADTGVAHPHPIASLVHEIARDDGGRDGAQRNGRAASAQPTGFWDPSSPDGTPRDVVADDRPSAPRRSSAIGNPSPE